MRGSLLVVLLTWSSKMSTLAMLRWVLLIP